MVGIPNEAELYDETSYRPGSDRINALLKTGGYWLAEKVVASIPRLQGNGLFEDIVNLTADGYEDRYSQEKHKYGRMAFENTIPVARKVIQNLWSLGHLQNGMTNMGSFYTVNSGGQEYVFHIEREGSPASVVDIVHLADQITGNEIQQEQNVTNPETTLKAFADEETTQSGAFLELTDGDILDTKDYGRFLPIYAKSELFYMGQEGERSVVGYRSNGDEIVKYEKPSPGKMLKYYGAMDINYTLLSTAIGAAERSLPGVALQSIFEKEAADVEESTRQKFSSPGGLRYDGATNPLHRVYRMN